MRGPGLSDVRGKWPGKELVGMNFVGSAKAGREGRRAGVGRGLRGAGAPGPGAERPRVEREAWTARGRETRVQGRDPGAPTQPAPRPAPAAWQSSKRVPDCYALCFLLRAEPSGMGLVQAVSLPRGGGTLKGQRPLPAATARPHSTPQHLRRPLDPLPRGDRPPKPGSGREGTRGGRPGGGAAPGGVGHVPREPGGQEVRLRAGLGRLGPPGSVPGARRG